MANEKPVSMKTKEYRKVVKPLLERRRRARINGCLNELRNFILEATKQDSVQASKLEKADILEMTVHYLKLLLRQQCGGRGGSREANIADLSRYRAGFTECANEVSMVVSNMALVNPQVRGRLLTHLSKCLDQMDCINNISMPQPIHHPSEGSAASVLPPSPPHSLSPTTPMYPLSPNGCPTATTNPLMTTTMRPEGPMSWPDRPTTPASMQHSPSYGPGTPPAMSPAVPSPRQPATCGSAYSKSRILMERRGFSPQPVRPVLVAVMDPQSQSLWRPW